MSAAVKTHFVDPGRLAYEGDIHKAYSGDAIMGGRIRAVVAIEGKPYVVTGTCGDEEANLWPLLTVAQWGRSTTTYEKRCRCRSGEFTYEAIEVKLGKDVFVMGPRSGEITVKGVKRKMKATPMPAGAEDLAALLVDRVAHYERNCRCPKCHGGANGPLPCIECDFCISNLRKLFLADLLSGDPAKTGNGGAESQPVPFDFSCAGNGSRANISPMKNKTRKTAAKAKAKTKAKPKSRIGKAARAEKKTAQKMKKPAAPSLEGRKKKPVSISTGPRSGDSDRGLYVRFDSPAVKATVKKAADATGVSMNAYIVAATLDWVENGKELKPSEKNDEPVAATG